MDITNKDKLIGIDLGGTKLNAGKIENGIITAKDLVLIPADSENEWDVINVIIDSIKKLNPSDIQGIGLGIPSIVDREKGIVYDVTNIKSWKKVHLKSILEKEFNVPVCLDNDANCFALGEFRFGAAKNCNYLVGLTIGTGMGGGIITNGYLQKDANGGAGEFGLISYRDSNYEAYCSGQFFRDNYNSTGEEMAQRAEDGDIGAIIAFSELGKHIGNAIKMIKYAVDPDKIIIGGSVAKSRKLFESAMYEAIKDFEFPSALTNFEILFSDTPDIAIYGAASLYYDQYKV